MKTRTYKELLTLMLNSEEVFNRHYCAGLCGLVYWLYGDDSITETEYNIMTDYISDNRPLRRKHYACKWKDNAWYWKIHEWTPRKAWLEFRITKH